MKLEKKVKQTLEKINLNKRLSRSGSSKSQSKEKILVALSGGKDSAVVAFILKKLGYNFEALYVDLCVGEYSKKCLKKIQELCEKLKIKLHIYDLKKQQGKSMLQIWKKTNKQNLNHCSACGIIKKWVLNKKARELKADKIITGHNIDDEIQTFLINIFKGSLKLSTNAGVITKNISNKKFIPRIKPLYYIFEEDVLKYALKNKIPFLKGKCPYAETSYRIEVRDFLEKVSRKEKLNIMKNFEKNYPKIEKLKKGNLNYCEICGEPCRRRICKRCELMKIK